MTASTIETRIQLKMTNKEIASDNRSNQKIDKLDGTMTSAENRMTWYSDYTV